MLQSLQFPCVLAKPFRLFSPSGWTVTAMRGRDIFAGVIYASTMRHGHKGQPYNGRRQGEGMSVSVMQTREYPSNRLDEILWGNPRVGWRALQANCIPGSRMYPCVRYDSWLTWNSAPRRPGGSGQPRSTSPIHRLPIFPSGSSNTFSLPRTGLAGGPQNITLRHVPFPIECRPKTK